MIKKNKKNFLIFSFVFFIFFSFALYVRGDRQLEVNYPEIFGLKLNTINTTLPEYAKYIFNFAIATSGIVALFVLVWGGILYLTSVGNVPKIKKAREQIFGGTVGLIILLSSYLLLYNINPTLLVFNVPPLNKIISSKPLKPALVITGKPTLIVEELPLVQGLKNGVWEKKRTEELKQSVNNLEKFLKEKTKINDSELSSPFGFNSTGSSFAKKNLNGFETLGSIGSNSGVTFDRISDLNKYLKTLTDECHCQNLTALCSKPEVGSLPVGCTGDPCQLDQSVNVEPDSPRARIDKILNVDRKKIKHLLEHKQIINKQKNILREELRKFQAVEKEIISCQSENRDIETITEYLADKNDFEKSGGKVIEIPNYWNSHGDKLTFYCSGGGTIYDYLYNPTEEISLQRGDFSEELISSKGLPEEFTKFKELSCPLELPLGDTVAKIRELAALTVFRLERTSLLINDMSKELQKMTELVSHCNEKKCNINCACVPNPCYGCCSPIPCDGCVIFCKDRCLQAVGVCNGDACPVKDIEKESEEIKKTEDKIFETINQIKDTFPRVSALLEGKEEPYNLHNITTLAGLCYSSGNSSSAWKLLSCKQAKGSYGPNNEIISSCNPQNFYCCSLSGKTAVDFLGPTEAPPTYVIPAKNFEPMAEKNNCPIGWICRPDVTKYNQYKDASKPLKQLLSCMRNRLNRIQQEEGLKNTIGIISSISDSKIYKGTCDWNTGPTEEGGCSHIYEINRGKERVSSHYGGPYCQYDHKSYAVDISLTPDFQKEYGDRIIEAAKKCEPGVYIIDEVSHFHIDISRIYNCR